MWPIFTAVGITLCILAGSTTYDMDITQMPGYNQNYKLKEFVATKQFPMELAFDYKRYGLSSRDFYPR